MDPEDHKRGYIEGFTAIKCPTCGQLLVEFSVDGAAPLWTPTPTVRCINPNCKQYGRSKTFTRPSVELIDVDAQKPTQV